MKMPLLAVALFSFATLAVAVSQGGRPEKDGVGNCGSSTAVTRGEIQPVESARACAKSRVAGVSGSPGKASAGPLTISTPSVLPPGGLGQGYGFLLVIEGGMAPYSFGIPSGALPPGLTITSTGVIEGTPVLSGIFGFTVMVSDSAAQSVSKAFMLTIFDGVPDPLGFVSQSAVPLNSFRVHTSLF